VRDLIKFLRYAVWPLCFVIAVSLPGQQTPEDPLQLLNRLAGDWVLEGILGGKQVKHDVTAEWILNHEYLRLHEVSRDRTESGDAAYEAIILFSWDTKASEYRCLWLDNTDGGGLSVPIARAKQSGESIQIAFPAPYESLHTAFKYDKRTDTWQLLIDDLKDGRPHRFGDAVLRRSSHVPRSNNPDR
jgi:hypothetical protein